MAPLAPRQRPTRKEKNDHQKEGRKRIISKGEKQYQRRCLGSVRERKGWGRGKEGVGFFLWANLVARR